MKYVNLSENTVAELVGPASAASKRAYARFGKRAFDITFVLAVLPLVLPVLLILWALTKADGGPGLYVQKRIGRGGRVFNCYKIRSMVVDADQRLTELCENDPEVAREWALNQKLDNDPRITRVGAFVRATSLDELPQLFNILLGDMSVVGPRPFSEDQEKMYRDGGGKAYFSMRPGITGPWQIYGRGTTTFLDRIRYDEAYRNNLSFFGDVMLIAKTAGVVVNCTGK